MEVVKNCPICNADKFSESLIVNDHFHSAEHFTIASCTGCGFKFTNPRPDGTQIGNYYASEKYISHSDESKGFINNIYKLVRNYTLGKKVQLITKLANKKGNLLDIGCGTGAFLNACKNSGWNTTGIEPGDMARNFAVEKYKLNILNDINLLADKNEAYDVITMWHVLEHVPDLNDTIITLKRLLKKDGVLLIAVPNCNSYDTKLYQAYWAAYDVPRHFWHFTQKDIKSVFEKHNMYLINTLPMLFDSFYISMLSEKYKYGKTNYMSALINGFISNFKGKAPNYGYSSQIYIIQSNQN